MPARFKVEHVATTPHGYKVRTVLRDGHRVRIAFPPGRRVTGSGRVVQVLHPRNENPCRLPNPAELVVMMANPHNEGAKATHAAAGYEHPSRHIGQKCSQCRYYVAAVVPSCQKVVNPIRAVDWCQWYERRVANPSEGRAASNLYEQFHGRAAQHMDEYDEPTPRTATMTELGDLVELRMKTDVGWKLRSLDFTGDGIKVASNTAGTQIYFIGGNQRIRSLAPFGADRSKELLDLGECRYIAYRTRKAQVNNIPATYEHFLGEDTDAYPRLMYDRRGREPRLYFTGGAYHVAPEGIVN